MELQSSWFLLEGDALNIVQRIKSSEPDLSLIGNLIHVIRFMMADFHDGREGLGNVPAHILAKM